MTTVAETVLDQLGGSRFIAMTGACALIRSANTLSFQLPRKARRGIKGVRIVLRDDLYDIEFAQVSTPRYCGRTGTFKGGYEIVAKHEGVAVDQLKAVFTRETGLDPHL